MADRERMPARAVSEQARRAAVGMPAASMAAIGTPSIVVACGWCTAETAISLCVLAVWPCGEMVVLCPACRAAFEGADPAMAQAANMRRPLGFFGVGRWMPFQENS